MINITDLYNATRDGLDIILDYYPQAAECVNEPKKKFKRRQDETDASACLRKFGDCYKVTDFGDTATAMSPIDICMSEEGIGFREAVVKLAGRFGVKDELNREVNKPEIKRRPANPDEREGSRFFELEERFTAEQLAVLGPNVRQEDTDFLHWHVAKSISYVKDRVVTTKYTTPTYPILMRECVLDNPTSDGVKSFFKIYEPLNCDKQFRFSYTPEGVKPRKYINGLAELRHAYVEWNKDEERAFLSEPMNEGKPYVMKKLPEAFICSGERDALCCKAHGYFPLWFNSETYHPDAQEIRTIYKYVEVLYNIPDIDATGIRKGTELALEYTDIVTVWLPTWLGTYRDRRGKPRKDLRDFVDVRPTKQDFRNLLSLAMPAKFWQEKWSERSKAMTYTINTSFLHYFLSLNGFYTLKDDNSDEACYIRRSGMIVQRIRARDIMTFLKEYARKRFLPVEIRNLILDSPRTGESTLSQLDEVDLNFDSYTPDSQYIFFQNDTWRITSKGIEPLGKVTGDGHYVWADNVLPHQAKLLPPMFRWTHETTAEGEDRFDIEVTDTSSCFFSYLINTSRVHWRKELEELWADRSIDEAEAYRAAHKFDIAGPVLTAAEVAEQKQNLLNKIYCIGYQLHQYKSPSRAWAIYAMDNKVGDEDECNGRSGKSFFFTAFHLFMNTVKLSGRNPKLLDNPHVFDQVNKHTRFVYVDDCDRYLPMSQFYDIITGGMTVNPKNNRSFYLDFETSPKMGFSTNYVPKEFTPSTSARLLYMVFSDYYHQKTEENDYLESRSIYDDFGHNLMKNSDYTEEMWNADFNFFAQCLAFYLKVVEKNVKIQPPMGNILMRKAKADMGASFEDWAYTYFAKDGEHVNIPLVRKNVFQDFLDDTKTNKTFWTMQRFTRALKGFVKVCDYMADFNPADMLNESGRFQRRIDDKTEDMIYLRTYTEEGDFAPIKDTDSTDDKPF